MHRGLINRYKNIRLRCDSVYNFFQGLQHHRIPQCNHFGPLLIDVTVLAQILHSLGSPCPLQSDIPLIRSLFLKSNIHH